MEQTVGGSSEQTGQMEQVMLHPVGKLAARNNTTGERWQRPNDAAWHKAHRKAAGSGGPDGTTGVEIHNLPSPVISLIRTLTKAWERTKLAPTSMSQIRQAALQKPGKPNTIPNLRPIAVMSAWWRLYESASVQSDSFVAWRHNIGRGHNVWHTSRAASKWQQQSIKRGGTRTVGMWRPLDFSKAFDHMAPELSKQAMIAAGWSENIATLMAEVWKAQKRTVCFGGHQDPISLRTTHAHPQGGPLGPTVCQLWLLGGAEWTAEQRHNRRNSVAASEEKAKAATEPAQRKRRKPNDRREVDAVYMDDRSPVRGDARSLVASVKDWQAWSEGVQMQENWSKLQMMGKTARQQEQLKAQVEEAGRPQWAEHVTEEAEILGTALTRSGRIGTKQTKTMTKFTDRLAILQAIPSLHARRLSHCSSDPGKFSCFVRLGHYRTLYDPAQHSSQQDLELEATRAERSRRTPEMDGRRGSHTSDASDHIQAHWCREPTQTSRRGRLEGPSTHGCGNTEEHAEKPWLGRDGTVHMAAPRRWLHRDGGRYRPDKEISTSNQRVVQTQMLDTVL